MTRACHVECPVWDTFPSSAELQTCHPGLELNGLAATDRSELSELSECCHQQVGTCWINNPPCWIIIAGNICGDPRLILCSGHHNTKQNNIYHSWHTPLCWYGQSSQHRDAETLECQIQIERDSSWVSFWLYLPTVNRLRDSCVMDFSLQQPVLVWTLVHTGQHGKVGGTQDSCCHYTQIIMLN